MKKTVIFTDLDGTLLDEASYSYAEAHPALDLVVKSKTPLIFCSSKTRAELEGYRARMNNTHPFISENGGGIFVPQGYFTGSVSDESANGYQLIRLGLPYAEIREHFSHLREQTHAKVRGFADMTTAEVAALTGLSEEEAALAKQRDFDEPFVFEDEPDEAFLQAIKDAGLHWTQGRLFHVMGKHDKGRAVDILMSFYRQQYEAITSIALGDSLNDLAMLAVVDQPVLVRHRDGSCDNRIAMLDLLNTRLPGPAGWNEAVLKLLSHELEKAAATPAERENMLAIFNAALTAVDPCRAVLNAVRIKHNQLIVADRRYELTAFERVIVVGAGKATARMAVAVESLLDDRLTAGMIVVKNGHTAHLTIIKQIEAGHPVPNEAGIAGTQSILRMLHAADEKTLVICLLSGGASALLVAPAQGIALTDKQATTQLLLNAGTSINQLNAVRKHLSSVKGGRLAQAACPAQLLTLILSDVIGDPLDVIASGPTAADHSTFTEAWAVITGFNLQNRLPPAVVDHLQRGIAGKIPETVKVGDPCLNNTHNVIIASNRRALAAAQEKALELRHTPRVISDHFQGEARDAAKFLAQAARTELAEMQPDERRCLLCGGETTVTVRDAGKGGRNQELALAFALEIEGIPGLSLLSAGTDGSDGPTDAAGAVVDGSTASRARKLGVDPRHHLDRNDSYTFFQRFDEVSGAHCHLKTGPTGTNVMDIQIVLLDKREHAVRVSQPDIQGDARQ